MKLLKIITFLFTLVVLLNACGPLNPINDFFGIQMNPTDEANFVIVKYTDVDGISYKNSINMNPNINAWAEITSDEITVKVVNNSNVEIPLNYTADQFIIITDEKEYVLGKGERAEYFKKGAISPKASEIFNIELPLDHNNIARSGSGNVSTRTVLRNYSNTESKLNVSLDDIEYFIVKLGKISIVLKKVPTNN